MKASIEIGFWVEDSLQIKIMKQLLRQPRFGAFVFGGGKSPSGCLLVASLGTVTQDWNGKREFQTHTLQMMTRQFTKNQYQKAKSNFQGVPNFLFLLVRKISAVVPQAEDDLLKIKQKQNEKKINLRPLRNHSIAGPILRPSWYKGLK